VSERAKALIKLAEKGLDCLSIPDVFPLIHDLVKSYSRAICGPLRHARQALSQARESLLTCQASPRSSEEVQQAQAKVETCRRGGALGKRAQRVSVPPGDGVADRASVADSPLDATAVPGRREALARGGRRH
jgi:hypothetical protein